MYYVLDPTALSRICAVQHTKLWWKWSKTVRRFAYNCVPPVLVRLCVSCVLALLLKSALVTRENNGYYVCL